MREKAKQRGADPARATLHVVPAKEERPYYQAADGIENIVVEISLGFEWVAVHEFCSGTIIYDYIVDKVSRSCIGSKLFHGNGALIDIPDHSRRIRCSAATECAGDTPGN